MIIRPETAADAEAITCVTIAAFKTLEVSHQTEHFIVKALRAAGALTLSLVAEEEGQVVGHIAFSPVTIAGKAHDWYGLGPISVLPERQRQGLGTTLVNKGLELLKEMGGQGCVLVGDPAYYSRFGFRNDPELFYEEIPQEFVLALPFGDTVPQGVIAFHEGFAATG